jgi:signal transduction histidine kinase
MIEASGATELGRLAAELAHDIRNPLHAIRLNLHALRLSIQSHGRLTADELESLFTESDREIDRIERRMCEFLHSASPGTANEE